MDDAINAPVHRRSALRRARLWIALAGALIIVFALLRGFPFPFSASDQFEDPWQLFQLQSLSLLLAGGIILWSTRVRDARRRRNVTVVMLLLFCVVTYTVPIQPSMVRMGDSNMYTRSRRAFEFYSGVQDIRYEAHLSYAVLGRLYRLFGQTEEAPVQAFVTLTRAATAWFVVSALAIGSLERWSAVILRYLALALLAPSALLYFGYRELGYLSLNLATYPLIARGLRDGGNRLEAGSVVAGLGAALHGFGLLSLAGAWIAAWATRARLKDRIGRALRIAAWGSAAYVGWIAVYVIILKLPVTLGHVESIPWRPWFVPEIRESRVNAAIFSAAGARDLLVTAWVVGAPLLVVAGSLWRQQGVEVRTALWYSLPSVLWVLLFWPVQGLAEEMDLVFAAFPALYAVAWICAHDPARTKIAAALLVSAHFVFWRIVLDRQFVNRMLE